MFTQFIDATWQITQQFPTEFEFNENYLFTIHDHVYSCQFGTFIGNCEREREEIDVKSTTYSLWAKLDSQREEYLNPLFNLSKESKLTFLQVQLLPQLIRYWRSMYNRFDFGIHPRECLTDLLTVTYNHTKSLEGHISFLKQKIDQIQLLKDANQKQSSSNLNLNDTKQNSIENQSIKSFDSINSSLKIVEECMQRLQLKHNQTKQDELLDGKTSNDFKIDLNLIELLNNCIKSVALDWQTVRTTRKCASCGSSLEQLNRTSNCWCCGFLHCCRCIEKRIRLPGHLFSNSNNAVVDNLDDEMKLVKLDHVKNKQQTIEEDQKKVNQQKNERNEQMNNHQVNYIRINEQKTDQMKYKVHPLEQQLDQQIDQNNLQTKQQNEQAKKLNNFKLHPLEALDNDDDNDDEEDDEEDDFEPIDPIELGIECEEANEINCIIQNDDENANLIIGSQTNNKSIYEYVPVCSKCYRKMMKVNT